MSFLHKGLKKYWCLVYYEVAYIGGFVVNYEDFNSMKIMALTGDKLAEYVNYMLSNGYTLSSLSYHKGIRRQTLIARLKRSGYLFDRSINRYVSVENGEKKIPLLTENIEAVEIVKILKDFERRLMAIEKNEKEKTKLLKNEKILIQIGMSELVTFNSVPKNKNYQLYPEVYELLNKVHKMNPHITIKDLVNSVLYKGLMELYEPRKK